MPDVIENQLNGIAADLLRGPNPTIPEDDDDGARTAFAFECAKEMLCEVIMNREFDDTTGGRIERIAEEG
jgi:hypothetical protein